MCRSLLRGTRKPARHWTRASRKARRVHVSCRIRRSLLRRALGAQRRRHSAIAARFNLRRDHWACCRHCCA
eukprot:4627101-Heterocapsa_arctica.AAC.1